MDPIQTVIMNNRFNAIVEEASVTLYRTAHTTFVKLVQDFQCGLATPAGEMFAYPSHNGVNAFIGLPIAGGLHGIGVEHLEPGDCIITNDPFSTDGMVTHIMDVSMVRPVFVGNELVALAWSFVHASDIGGAVPGSISPAFTEVFQEGLRVRPTKLYKRGQLDTAIRNIFIDNSRIADELWGDFQAMISALASMDKRLNQLCQRYGVAAVRAGMEASMALADAKARQVIRRIPDGDYPFADYVEGMSEGDFIHIHAVMRVRDERIVFDFSGTDPQVAAAFNYVTGARAHPYTLQAFIYYILTREPEAPRNAGLLRALEVIAPRGTVMNAEFPAAGGSRVTTSTRVYDVILGCLNAALADGLTAAGPGMSGVIVVSAKDPHGEGNRVSVINPLCGGGGGRFGLDGTDGVDSRSGYLRTVPAETIEAETVMRVKRYGLVTDSQAPGRWQSGAAIALELENTGPEAVMTVRGMNRFYFQSWGARGGQCGHLGSVLLNPGTDDERNLGKIDVLKMQRHDVVRLTSPSGGGFGDPFLRDPGQVAHDVRRGLVSVYNARASYGVAVDDSGRLDPDATARLRAGHSSVAHGLFTLGSARDRLDRVWPREIRAALAMSLMREERRLRQPLRLAVIKRLTAENRPVSLTMMAAVIAEELQYLRMH
ncbi:hydantoinase B/oxoprolinase family protein [Sodalis sp. RH20]|uniref:hydantoinase B/oxoprolinase family protein n=1 Tax=unclassified Sodalis (in: enterobacteria) TaxID=2636512 RepID=UPI0039B66441